MCFEKKIRDDNLDFCRLIRFHVCRFIIRHLVLCLKRISNYDISVSFTPKLETTRYKPTTTKINYDLNKTFVEQLKPLKMFNKRISFDY